MRNGWTETTLGDIAEVNMGQSPPGDTYNTEGIGTPFMQGSAEFGEHYPEPVKFCSAPAKVAEIGDLLLSVRAPVGDSNFANQRIAIGRGLATVRAKSGANTNFLRLVIQLNTAGLLATSGTGMFSSITGKNLREFAVNLPPLNEQKRIVDVVSSVDAYIDALQQQADTALIARNAVLHELLSVGGDDWTETTLGEVADTRLGKMLSATTDDGSGEMHPYLRNTNVRWWEVDLSDLKEMRFSKKDCETLTLLAGDLLICEGGEPGRAALLKKDLPGIFFQKAIHRVRCRVGLEPEFLAYWMHHLSRSEIFENFLTSTTIKHLTGEKLRQLPILMPSLTEQRRIVDVVSCMEEVIQSTEQAVVDAKSLRSGLLSDLLSGEHEIPASYDKFLQAA